MPDLLKIRGLEVTVATPAGPAAAVRGLDLDLAEGQVTGLVGESGCGKSLTAFAVAGLLPAGARRTAGSILFDGEDLAAAGEERLRQVRGKSVAMVFQDPGTALNPVMRVGEQVAEALRAHQALDKAEARVMAAELLAQVGIPEPGLRAGQYPHQFSGGMKQRAVLAAALACQPRLLIADEPTTALDVTVQRQILDLLAELRASLGLTVLLITHDLSLVARAADALAVMYAGRVVERGPAMDVLRGPRHPYTQALLDCLPGAGKAFRPLEGQVPALGRLPGGCAFHPRCGRATAACRGAEPAMVPCGPGREAACVLAGEGGHAA